MANHPPLNKPCFTNASLAYVEHVGEYLQVDGVKGDIPV